MALAARIENCFFTGSIKTASTYQPIYDGIMGAIAGGICGISSSEQAGFTSYSSLFISNCFNEGVVSVSACTASAGGISGYHRIDTAGNSNIFSCYNKGDIEVENTGTTFSNIYGGGIAGFAYVYNNLSANVYQCYNEGNVTGISSSGSILLGGIAGFGRYITNCFNKGEIAAHSTGNVCVGGISGVLSMGTLMTNYYCYNVGNIKAYSDAYAYAGEIFGSVGGTFEEQDFKNCYYINTLSMIVESGLEAVNSSFARSLAPEQMIIPSSFGDFDFDAIWDIHSEYNSGYPFLRGLIPAYNPNGFSATLDGWCIPNNSVAFGYADPYWISPTRYLELYGLILSELSFKTLKGIAPWNGNCFGLSLAAILNYNKQIDLSGYFSQSGNTLHLQFEQYRRDSPDRAVPNKPICKRNYDYYFPSATFGGHKTANGRGVARVVAESRWSKMSRSM